jgi:hypothetical protein
MVWRPLIRKKLPLSLLFLLGFALPATAEELQRHFSISGEEIVIDHLIGKLDLEGYDGQTFEIDITISGRDADPASLEFETKEGARARFTVVFPLDEEDRFVYPPMGHGSVTTLARRVGEDEGGWIRSLLALIGNDRIRISGSGKGLQIWADLRVRVPRGRNVKVIHTAGEIDAERLEGNVIVESQHGGIRAKKISGSLSIDTGSGAVTIEECNADLEVDTGSGSVVLEGCAGGGIVVDTGSGGVIAKRIDCSELWIDTGSGGVEAVEIRTDRATIDTGSGAIRLDLERIGSGRFLLDTGSGGIDLSLPLDASAEIFAETGSGGIGYELQGVDVRRIESDEAHLLVGDGTARIRLDSGSGRIKIHN